MWLVILISLLSLVFLLALHEGGHFAVAKAFGIEVKEFGIGYPPRVWGKKIGDTIYSLNLIPAGAFVDIPPAVLEKKSGIKRCLVLAAGVISFWVFALLFLAASLIMGAPSQIPDQAEVDSAWVQITMVEPGSPAEKAGIKAGDMIFKIKGQERRIKDVGKIKEAQDFIKASKGKEIEMVVQRGKKEVSVRVVPRVEPPQGEGPLGVVLARVAIKKWSFGSALSEAGKEVVWMSFLILREIGKAMASLFSRVETRLRLTGPVGITKMLVTKGSLGASYFLQTMGLISLNLALVNILPFLPITDGGKIFFLLLEKMKKEPLNKKLKERVNSFFFILLLILMVLVTVRDLTHF